MKYTQVFLQRFTTGENAAQLRQMLGMSVQEIEFMLAEIEVTNEVTVTLLNNLDAVPDSFAIALEAPECSEFDSLKFLFHNVNNGTYGVSANIEPVIDIYPENLDKKIQLVFAPTP